MNYGLFEVGGTFELKIFGLAMLVFELFFKKLLSPEDYFGKGSKSYSNLDGSNLPRTEGSN